MTAWQNLSCCVLALAGAYQPTKPKADSHLVVMYGVWARPHTLFFREDHDEDEDGGHTMALKASRLERMGMCTYETWCQSLSIIVLSIAHRIFLSVQSFPCSTTRLCFTFFSGTLKDPQGPTLSRLPNAEVFAPAGTHPPCGTLSCTLCATLWPGCRSEHGSEPKKKSRGLYTVCCPIFVQFC